MVAGVGQVEIRKYLVVLVDGQTMRDGDIYLVLGHTGLMATVEGNLVALIEVGHRMKISS